MSLDNLDLSRQIKILLSNKNIISILFMNVYVPIRTFGKLMHTEKNMLLSYSKKSVDPLSHDFSHRIIRVLIGRADFIMRVIYIKSSAVTHARALFNFYSFKIL